MEHPGGRIEKGPAAGAPGHSAGFDSRDRGHRDAFYYGNFARLLGSRAPAAPSV